MGVVMAYYRAADRGHRLRMAQVAGLWRSRCSCGWRSRPNTFHGAEEHGLNHVRRQG